MRARFFALVWFLAWCSGAMAQQPAPRENPYDLILKIFQPLFGVFLSDTLGENRAASFVLDLAEVGGRLPQEMKGATLRADVQFPDKFKIVAPVLGETFTLCRNGDQIWAVPGSKAQYLLSQFRVVPQKNSKWKTPLPLPVSAQQAVFLPALFAVSRPEVAEIEDLRGESCRVLTAGLMPELAKAAGVEDFRARVWIAAGHKIRRVEIKRRDSTVVVDVREMSLVLALPVSTWVPPEGQQDIYRANSDLLEGFVGAVMGAVQRETQSASGPAGGDQKP